MVRARAGRSSSAQTVDADRPRAATRWRHDAGHRGAGTAGALVVCAGLQADRMARIAGLTPTLRIVPFRGEYYRLPRERSGIVERLIYPVPDPDLPFLGVHLTR